MTLVQFDSQQPFEVLHDFDTLSKVKLLNEDIFTPRGMTPLLDAIGKTIHSTGEKLSTMKEEDRPEKVIVVIITDGQENASHEFNKSKISEMIKHQTDIYDWKFVFLGANQDAIAEAGNIGISANSAMQYAANGIGTTHAFLSVSSGMTQMRSMDKCAMKSAAYFSDKDRKNQQDAGVADYHTTTK